MVSPKNTYVGLTHGGPGTAADEPGKYKPRGVLNFVRVMAADDIQGAANAELARDLGARRVFAIRDGGSYGDGVAAAFTRAARRLGLTASTGLWRYDARSYAPFLAEVLRARPNAVFVGTFLLPESARLVKELRVVHPPRTRLLVPDGFTPFGLVEMVGT
jgi:branched-chain amino acid transport system substrate-binding protein